MKLPREKGAQPHPSPQTTEERLAALEARNPNLKWWRNPVWLSLLVAAAVGVNQIKPWDWWEPAKPKPTPPPGVVRLTEPHAAAYASNQWEAQVRVINNTRRNIKVERVKAVFGKASYGTRCDRHGNATRILYPEAAPNQPRNAYQPLQRGEGAVFRGSPNLDKRFGGKPCPLATAKLEIPQDRATFTALTDTGAKWAITTTLLYEPTFKVEGAGSGGGRGGGLPCILPFLPGCL